MKVVTISHAMVSMMGTGATTTVWVLLVTMKRQLLNVPVQLNSTASFMIHPQINGLSIETLGQLEL